MGDLYSKNYLQTSKIWNIFNPLKYVYRIESILMKKYELLCFENFQKTFLFSKKEIKTLNDKKNIYQINFGIDKIFKKFKYSKKNYKIIFIGNIKYLPNRLACKKFISKVLPKILKVDPNIQFHIIGEISKINKFLWSRNKSVKIHGKVSNLKPLLSKSFCGLANLEISSGIQTKILTYMSFGIPVISSNQVINNFDAINYKYFPKYKNQNELVNLIFKLKNNKVYSNGISKRSLQIIKKFKWENVLKSLDKM